LRRRVMLRELRLTMARDIVRSKKSGKFNAVR
jgi:hypothetical protein